MLETKIDPVEWKRELERVGPRLKVRVRISIRDRKRNKDRLRLPKYETIVLSTLRGPTDKKNIYEVQMSTCHVYPVSCLPQARGGWALRSTTLCSIISPRCSSRARKVLRLHERALDIQFHPKRLGGVPSEHGSLKSVDSAAYTSIPVRYTEVARERDGWMDGGFSRANAHQTNNETAKRGKLRMRRQLSPSLFLSLSRAQAHEYESVRHKIGSHAAAVRVSSSRSRIKVRDVRARARRCFCLALR